MPLHLATTLFRERASCRLASDTVCSPAKS
ncbi:hypothetical protein PC110_g19633, partial [Phytophthora cactorum]